MSRPLAAWAALLAMLVQGLLPVSHALYHAALQHHAAPLVVAKSPGPGTGIGHEAPEPAQDDDHPGELCHGFFHLGAGLAPSAAASCPALAFERVPPAPHPAAPPLAARPRGAAQPRAPPSLV